MSTPKIPTRESHIEDYLVKRAKAAGGECRKLKWIGRDSAPDRVVMLPGFVQPTFAKLPETIWVEVKAPGGKAKFPQDAREHAQAREHERMRKAGQRVEIVDSYEGVDALFD